MPDNSSGCFSWLKWRRAKTRESKKNSPVEPPTGAPKEVEAGEVSVPAKKEYAIEATKRTIDIISSVVGLVGVPLVKEVLHIGLSIITTCETINAVQEKVAELKNRVASFLLVIAKVAKDPEDNPLFKISQGLMEELEDLKSCLTRITNSLEAINNQNIVLTTLLPDANLKTIDECVSCFQDAIDRFQTLRGIHAAEDLAKIQNQLEDIYGLTKVVVQKVDHIETEVREMKSSVDELRTMLDKTSADANLFSPSAEMSPVPEIFLGRGAVVNRIAEELSSGDTKRSRVCILGPGGMGKTSTALAAIRHPLVMANALLAYLGRRFGIPSQTDPLKPSPGLSVRMIIPILFSLTTSRRHGIPWQTLTRNILRELDKLSNISILLTMRSEFPPLGHWHAERLDVLTLQDCRDIYTAIQPEADSTEGLDLLMGAIGCLPYAVTLVATQAKYADATPSQMLCQWQTLGSEMLENVDDNLKGMNRSIELSVKSKYVTSSTGAIELLQVLSMLPGGVYQDDVLIWAKSLRVTALNTLRNAALVVTREILIEGMKKMHLLVLPVVQSYMQQHGRIPESIRRSTQAACIEFLCTYKSLIKGPNDPRWKVDFPAVKFQETNVEAMLTEILQQLHPKEHTQTSALPLQHPSTEYLDAFLVFAYYHLYTRPRLDVAEQVLALTKLSGSHLHEAEATYCLAKQQQYLDLDQVAVSGFEKARDMYLALDNSLKACISDTRRLLSQREEGLTRSELLTLRAAICSKWEPFYTDKLVYAMVVAQSAYALWLDSTPDDTEYQTILPDLLEARDIFQSQCRPFDLRGCQLYLMRYYLGENQPHEAQKTVDEAISLVAQECLPENSFFQLTKARCLKALDCWGPELHSILSDGLAIAQRSGWPYDTAVILEEFGELYVREEDRPAAHLAYETILKKCRKGSGKSIDMIVARARHNLAFIISKQAGQDDGSVEYLSPERC